MINRLFKIYYDTQNDELKKTLYEFMNNCMTAIHSEECQKNWSRFDNFFKMLYEIAIAGKPQVEFFLKEHDTIMILLDFMMGEKSPLLKTGEKRI